MARDFCWWCAKELTHLPDTHNNKKGRAFCNATCYIANELFEEYFSDEEYLMRSYWKGDRYEQFRP